MFVDFMLYNCRENHVCEIWYDFVKCTFMDYMEALEMVIEVEFFT